MKLRKEIFTSPTQARNDGADLTRHGGFEIFSSLELFLPEMIERFRLVIVLKYHVDIVSAVIIRQCDTAAVAKKITF